MLTKEAFFSILAETNTTNRLELLVSPCEPRVFLNDGRETVVAKFRTVETMTKGLIKLGEWLRQWNAANDWKGHNDNVALEKELASLSIGFAESNEIIAAVNRSPRLARMARCSLRSAVESWDRGDEFAHFDSLTKCVSAYVMANMDDHRAITLMGDMTWEVLNPALVRIGDSVETEFMPATEITNVCNGRLFFAGMVEFTALSFMFNVTRRVNMRVHGPKVCHAWCLAQKEMFRPAIMASECANFSTLIQPLALRVLLIDEKGRDVYSTHYAGAWDAKAISALMIDVVDEVNSTDVLYVASTGTSYYTNYGEVYAVRNSTKGVIVMAPLLHGSVVRSLPAATFDRIMDTFLIEVKPTSVNGKEYFIAPMAHTTDVLYYSQDGSGTQTAEFFK